MLAITTTICLPDNGSAVEELGLAVKRLGGRLVGEPTISHLSDLYELPLRGRHRLILACLGAAGIHSREELQTLTEDEVLGIAGIKWRRYHALVRAMYKLGDRLTGAPGFWNMLELYEFPIGLYLDLRSSRAQDRNRHIPHHRTFATVSELMDYDFIGLMHLIGLEGTRDVIYHIGTRERDLAPLKPHWTIRDLYTEPGETSHRILDQLTGAGIDPGTLLTSLTAKFILGLVGRLDSQDVTDFAHRLGRAGLRYNQDPFGLAPDISRRAEAIGAQ